MLYHVKLVKLFPVFWVSQFSEVCSVKSTVLTNSLQQRGQDSWIL